MAPATANSMIKEQPETVGSWRRSPRKDRVKARERYSPRPVDSAPFWNGWNSFSVDEMPGPVSVTRI